MTKPLITILLAALICYNASAQTDQTPFIEVTGIGDTTFIPDEFYVTIKLKDNNKTPITEQEESLKVKLTGIGISLKNLTMLNMIDDYYRSSIFNKTSQIEQDFLLKITNLDTLKLVFLNLKELNVDDAFLSKISNSKIDDYRKAARIKAVKDAKKKATYMTEAIGQQIGKALEINEKEISEALDNADYYAFRGNVYSDYYYSKSKESIEFNKIKLSYKVQIKFEIK